MVVVDLDPERVAEVPHPALIGDVTDDDVLREAGIMRATALVAAINTEEVTVRAAPGWPGAPSGRRMRARRPARLCWRSAAVTEHSWPIR